MTTFEVTGEGSYFKADPEIIGDQPSIVSEAKQAKYLKGIFEKEQNVFYMFHYSQLVGFSFDPQFIEVHKHTITYDEGAIDFKVNITSNLSDIEPQTLSEFPAFFTGVTAQLGEITLEEAGHKSKLAVLGVEHKYSEGMMLSFLSNDCEWASVQFPTKTKSAPVPRFGHSFVKVNEEYGFLYGGFIACDDLKAGLVSNPMPREYAFMDYHNRGFSVLSNDLWKFRFRLSRWERCLYFDIVPNLNRFTNDTSYDTKEHAKVDERGEQSSKDAIIYEASKLERCQKISKPGSFVGTKRLWESNQLVKRAFADYSFNYPPSKPIKQTAVIDIHDSPMSCIYYIGNEHQYSVNCLTLSIFNYQTGTVEVHELRKRISREYLICDAAKDYSNNTIVIFSGKADGSAVYIITVYCLLTHKSKSFQSTFFDINRVILNVRNFQLKFTDGDRKLLLLGGSEPKQALKQQAPAIYVLNWEEYRETNVAQWIKCIRNDTPAC